MSRYGALGLAVAFLSTGCARRPPGEDAYVRSIEQWRAGRIARLKKPDGWLSLAGLFWLEPGANAVGSDRSNAVVLPPSAPAHAGTIVVEGKEIRWEPVPGAAVETGGKLAEAMPLVSDENGDPTVLTTGTVSFFVIRRGEKTGVRVRDSAENVQKELDSCVHFQLVLIAILVDMLSLHVLQD